MTHVVPHQNTTPTPAPTRVMYVGLALTVLVTLAPFIDVMTADTISDHVREAYPDWPADNVTADRNAIVGYLGVVGALGVAGWLWTIRLVTRRTRRARLAATIMFTLGAITALTNVSYGSEAYTTFVPGLHGGLGLLPVLAGAFAVVRLWRQQTPSLNPERRPG